MTNKLTSLLLALLITILFSGFYKNELKPNKGIKFKMLTSTIKSDTSAVIDVIIDNGEREREFTIDCTIKSDSLLLRGDFQAWYFNYHKTYTASIPIK